MRAERGNSGFTLMEIMVVVIIIGLLAAIVVPNYLRHAENAKMKTTKVQIKIIEQALADFKLTTGRFPTTAEGIKGLVVKPADFSANWPRDGFLPEVPKDGWGREFTYKCPGSDRAYEILSYGADGVEGGEDEYADITN